MTLPHWTTRLVGCRSAIGAAVVLLLACSGDPSITPADTGLGTSPYDAGGADAGPPVNHALAFDGLTEYATTGSGRFPSGNTPQSISMWVRYSSAATTQAFMVVRNDSGGGLKFGIRGGKLSAWTVLEGKTLVAAGLPSPNKWHHVAYVFDGQANILYVDGTQGARSNDFQNWNPYVASWLGSNDGLSEFYAGAMDEVRFWSVARTSAQISEEMKGQVTARDNGLVLYFDCNVAFGSRLPDKSGNGNDATLGGGDPKRMPTLVSSEVPAK